MNTPNPQRVLRQHLKTDQLLGVASVPLGQVVSVAPPGVSAGPDTQAGVSPMSDQATETGSSAGPASPQAAPTARRDKVMALEALDRDEVRGCTQCGLCQSRTQTVFGEGDPDAQLMFIGEGPGQNEDQQGRPFVGRAGELLNRQITAMQLTRERVYIANVVKCRPPNNRAPTPVEVNACWSYLRRQVQIIQPSVIVTLGGPATKLMLNTTKGITAIRGTWHQFDSLAPQGPSIPVMPTFHPAYLLRAYTPENRQRVWSDLQSVMQRLDQASG